MASYYRSENLTSGAGSLLLLHEAFQTKQSWGHFAKFVQERGYNVLALDLRGHGGSDGERRFDESMVNDIDAALVWLKTSPDVNVDQIGIAGASLGANLGLIAGAKHPEIQSLALLSPGRLLWELDISDAIVEYGKRPVLLVVSEEDRYPYESVQFLSKNALGDYRVEIVPGAAHGTEMLKEHPDLIVLLLEWFQDTLD